MLKKTLFVIFGIVVFLVLGLVVGSFAYRDVPAATLEAQYATPSSSFMDLDGVRIHYRVEGSGPTLVLIHAHYASLLMWDPWVAVLKDRYRIVRFDMTSHGLTGPDPSGDYSLPRTVKLFEGLVDALAPGSFALAGTSLGGTVAMHYAARHPERVERLVLISPGALNSRVRGRTKPLEIPRVFDVLTVVTPRFLAKAMLRSGFGDPDKVSDPLVDEWYNMWRREGNRKAEFARMRQYVSGDVEALIRAIRSPVLLIWGEANPQVTVDQAEQLRKLLVNAPAVEIDLLPGVGHMAVQEAPAQTAARVATFLAAGELRTAALASL